MMANLTPEQQQYLQGLRNGNGKQAQLIIRDQLTDGNIEDFGNFTAFLAANGHPDPTSDDLFLRVRRTDFLRMLFYADDRDRNCLVLQNCFGLTTPSSEGIAGRVVIIQKGNFEQIDGRTDDDFFDKDVDTVFRNAQGKLEMFLNMNPDAQLSVEEASQFINNFLTTYPKERLDATEDPLIHGYLLPVRALIDLLTNSAHPLAQIDTLTFRWGITRFTEIAGLGNFTLVIGAGDISNGPIIEFRTESIKGTGEGDCPPRSGCQLGVDNG